MGNSLYVILVSTLRMSIPMILVTTGGAFSVRSGITDLACEGMMIAGACFGVYGSYLTGSPWLGCVFAMVFGILFALLHGIMHITFRVNPNISGVAANLLSAAVAPLLVQQVWGVKNISVFVSSFNKLDYDWLAAVPVIGNLLNSQNVLFYITILIVAASWFYMTKTPSGLRLRMVGENPAAAATVGINTVAYKYFGVIMCGALSGLGGAYLSLGQLNLFVNGMTAGRGYIAMVINAIGRYNPLGGVVGSLVFGFFDSLQNIIQNQSIPPQLVMMLPYTVTLCVIAFGMRNAKPPVGMGKHHDAC